MCYETIRLEIIKFHITCEPLCSSDTNTLYIIDVTKWFVFYVLFLTFVGCNDLILKTPFDMKLDLYLMTLDGIVA